MADTRSEIRNWLRNELSKAKYGAKTKLAAHLGVRPDTITRMLSDGVDKERRDVKAHELAAMVEFFGSAPSGYRPPAEGAPERTYVPLDDDQDWLPSPDADGIGYDRNSYQPSIEGAIPELDARAGAGEGAVGEVMVLPMGGSTKSGHKITGEWLIPQEYLREAVGNPENAIVLGIQGDSMMPNYAPGDRVIIDLSEHELRADGVYLISDGVNAPQIKRLQIVPFSRPAKCRIISDNPLYQPVEIETDLLHIMGKVSAYIGRR